MNPGTGIDPSVAEALGLDGDAAGHAEDAAIDREIDLIDRLVQIRRDREMTQKDVAEKMDRTQPAVSDFERLGGDPHLSTVRRYAGAVGASIHFTVVVQGESDTGVTFGFSPVSVHDDAPVYRRALEE